MIFINGKRIGVAANNVNISTGNGKIVINGVDVTKEAGDSKEVNIVIKGDVHDLEVDNCNTVEVEGNSGSIRTTNGDVKVKETVKGNIMTTNGDVDVKGSIYGDVQTMNGDINY